MDYTALAFLVTRSQAGDNEAMSELYTATLDEQGDGSFVHFLQ